VASALIQAGCLGAIGGDISRSRLALECQTFNLLTDKEKALCITLADKPEVNHDVLKAIVYLRDNKDEKGKPLFSRATRFSTIKKKYEKYKEIWEMNRRNEKLANYFYERTILGFSYSHSLREIFGEEVDGLMSVADVEAAKQDDKVRMIGFVKEPVKSKTKAGNDGFRFILTDETGEITVRFFNQTIDQVFTANGRLPEESDLVLVKATKKEGLCAFANEVGIQTCKIYMKLSELKEAGEKAETGLATSPTETTSAPAA
jgi:DNA polymerase III alpha subunit